MGRLFLLCRMYRIDSHQCFLCSYLWLHGLCMGRLCGLCCGDVAVLFCRTEEVSYRLRLEGHWQVCSSSHSFVLGIRGITFRKCMVIVAYPYLFVDGVCCLYCEARFPIEKFTGYWEIFQIKRKGGSQFPPFLFISSLISDEPNLLLQNLVLHLSTIWSFPEQRTFSNHPSSSVHGLLYNHVLHGLA